MGRIVVLDDEARLLKTLRRFLEVEGHEVKTAVRFSEVEAGLVPGRFDVLVSDIVMPEQTGVDVLRMLIGRGCHEPVILMTGEPNVETASEAVRLGAYDYITKPVTKPQLLSVVTRALRHVELVRERDRARQAESSVLEHLARLGSSTALLASEVKDGKSLVNEALRKASEQLNGQHRQAVEELASRMDLLEVLLRRTLSFARPMKLELQPIDVGAIVAEAIRTFESETAAAVDFRPPPRPARVEADPTSIRALILNLLGNAREATGGRGRIVVELGYSPSDDVVLSVEDDGPGLSPAERSRLFVPFETSKPKAAGLGLPECKKIVEAHRGTIEIGDSPHGGARVRVVLPTG